MSKIEIEYNGAWATCKVDGKYLYQCDMVQTKQLLTYIIENNETTN